MFFQRKETPLLIQEVPVVFRGGGPQAPSAPSVRFKMGVIISLLAHGLLMGAILLKVPLSPLPPPDDFISVDLVEIQDVSKRQATSKTAEMPPKDAKIAPPKIEAKEPAKPAPKLSPDVKTAARESTPPPSDPLPPSKKETPKEELKPKPLEKPEKKETVKLEDQRPLEDLLKKEALAPKAPAETENLQKNKIPKEKPAPKKQQEKPVQKKETASKNTLNISELSALLNKTDDTEKSAPPLPALDTGALMRGAIDQMSGTDAQLSATILDAIRSRISECWNIPAGARDGASLLIRIEIKLNEDGSLAQYPALLNQGDHPAFEAAARSAQAAIEACAPYSFLPKDRYATWKNFIINFDPSQMLSP